jgi:hypothetical protein
VRASFNALASQLLYLHVLMLHLALVQVYCTLRTLCAHSHSTNPTDNQLLLLSNLVADTTRLGELVSALEQQIAKPDVLSLQQLQAQQQQQQASSRYSQPMYICCSALPAKADLAPVAVCCCSPFAHPGEKAKRRNIRTHYYSADMCAAVAKVRPAELP